MKIGAIIQARMGSTRLPGKTMKKLKGKTILDHVIFRVKKSKLIDEIIVATTINSLDDIIEDSYKDTDVKVFRGDEDNVLSRFYLAAKKFSLDIIVRITADDPLKDPDVIDQLIQRILDDSELDYCSNTMKPTYPEGIDAEVFRFSAIEKTYNEASLNSEKEHVTPYIYKNKDKFKVFNQEYSRDLSSWRWTLDNQDDWEFFTKVFDHFYNGDKFFGMEEVIKWLDQNPDIVRINQTTVRNEGYIKSLKEDKEKSK